VNRRDERRAEQPARQSAGRSAARPAGPWWDIWLTLSLLAAAIGFSPAAFLAMTWAGFSFDACAADACNRPLGGLAFALGGIGPSVVVVLLVAALIVRRRMRRTGWQVGVIAIAAQAVLLALAVVLTNGALAA
jgi:cobalamin synthase